MIGAIGSETDVPERRLFTVDEYARMYDAGIFGPEERLELLGGEIIRMCLIHPPHNGTVNMLARVLFVPLDGKAVVQIQGAIGLDLRSAPEPDVALLRWRDDAYSTRLVTPEDVLLLMEVSDTTLRQDRDVKAALYAAAGIPEYWIWDLPHRALMIHREPEEGAYRQVFTLGGEGVTASPLAFPDLVLRVEAILPPAHPD